jgi:ABC-type branched-subunit amino acid transport system substrate-binding protein
MKDDFRLRPSDGNDAFSSIARPEVSRRAMLGGVGLTALLAAVGCGSSGGSGSATATATAAGTATGAAGGGVGGTGLTAAELKQIGDMIDIGSFNAGTKGLAFTIGTQQALSSTISTFGLHFIKGIYVGIQHVKALGGPNFALNARDIGLYDPQRGIANALAFNQAHVPVVLDSYEGDATASLLDWDKFKILAIDPSNGDVPQPASNYPYFFGARAPFVVGCIPGVVKFLSACTPQVKHVSVLYPNVTGLGTALETAATTALKAAGMTSTTFEYTSGQTDWSQQINEIRSDNPDFVIVEEGDFDAGYFMRQYATSGIGKPVLCFEYNPTVQQVAGSALEGTFFTHDAFTPNTPTNDWQKLFVKSFEAQYHYTPDYYPAGYYEDVFLVWKLISRVMDKKGNVNSGADLLAALLQDPQFPSVFGGNGSTAGILGLSPTTHQTSIRPMTITQIKNGQEVTVANFGIDATGFSIVNQAATNLAS